LFKNRPTIGAYYIPCCGITYGFKRFTVRARPPIIFSQKNCPP